MLRRGHYACIGVPHEYRKGRFIVSTMRCCICGRVFREYEERPRVIDRIMDFVLGPPLNSPTCWRDGNL